MLSKNQQENIIVWCYHRANDLAGNLYGCKDYEVEFLYEGEEDPDLFNLDFTNQNRDFNFYVEDCTIQNYKLKVNNVISEYYGEFKNHSEGYEFEDSYNIAIDAMEGAYNE